VFLDLEKKVSATINETQVDRAMDPAELAVIGHRFMSIGEQMGHALQKTSVSVNIKKRLDFSCALFSPEGRLVANVPYVLVHLDSMEQDLMYQYEKYLGQLISGYVMVLKLIASCRWNCGLGKLSTILEMKILCYGLEMLLSQTTQSNEELICPTSLV